MDDDSKYQFVNEWRIFGKLYHRQGWYKEAKLMLGWALTGLDRCLGLEHLETIKVVINLAGHYHDRGKLDEAEEMWKEH